MKKCPKCKETKDGLQFYKAKQTKDKLSVYCRTCQKIRDKQQRQSRKKNGPGIIIFSKHCKKCDTTKPVKQFPIKRDAYDGYVSYCKLCWTAYVKNAIKKKLTQ
jgi:Zn ribbon nucleic-acid-binding protein